MPELRTLFPANLEHSFKSVDTFLEDTVQVKCFSEEENCTRTFDSSPETTRSNNSANFQAGNINTLCDDLEEEVSTSETAPLLSVDDTQENKKVIKSYLSESQVLEFRYKGSRSALKKLVAESQFNGEKWDFDKHGIALNNKEQEKLLEHTFLECLLLFQTYWQTKRIEDALKVYTELEEYIAKSSKEKLILAKINSIEKALKEKKETEDRFFYFLNFFYNQKEKQKEIDDEISLANSLIKCEWKNQIFPLSEHNLSDIRKAIKNENFEKPELTIKLEEAKKAICNEKIFENNSDSEEQNKLREDILRKDKKDQWTAWLFDECFVLANLFRLAVVIRFNRCFQTWEDLLQDKPSLAFDDKSLDGFDDFSDWFNSNLGNQWVSVFWIFWYLPRFFVNLYITMKHTFAFGDISDFEKKLSCTERFLIQLRLHGSQMANDAVWAGDNAFCWFIAHGMVSGLAAQWAMFFIVLLYVFDVINSFISYRLIRNEGDKAVTEVCLALAEGDSEKAKEYKHIIKKILMNPNFLIRLSNFSQTFSKIVGKECCEESNCENEFENVKAKIATELTENQLLTLRIAIGTERESRKKLVIQGLKLFIAVLLLACMITAAVLSLGTSLIPTAVIFSLKIVSVVSSMLTPLITFGSIYLQYSKGISPIPVGESSTYHKHNKHTFFEAAPHKYSNQNGQNPDDEKRDINNPGY